MSWLFIDTSQAGVTRHGLIDKKNTKVRTLNKRASSLLLQLAGPSYRNLRSIDGICVVAGPGSFSAVRGGVIVANLLARLLRKPLIGISRNDAEDIGRVGEQLDERHWSPQTFVEPIYDAEPNITVASSLSFRPRSQTTSGGIPSNGNRSDPSASLGMTVEKKQQ